MRTEPGRQCQGRRKTSQGLRILIAIGVEGDSGRDVEMNNPLKYFAELRDPRVERTREHLLGEILLMTIAKWRKRCTMDG